MTRFLKTLLCAGLLMAGVRGALGFALHGPVNEAWQVPTIGYNLPWYVDIGAPKNFADEYRRNVPIMFYTFDPEFEDYFGVHGMEAVDRAFAILNSLADVSSYSNDLSEFPLSTKATNFRASLLGLMDMKSMTLSLMMEQLGLAEPDRYTWNIRNRFVGPGGCPNDVDYLIVMRNYAIQPTALDTLMYSPYVNGAMLTYFIDEDCNVAPNDLDPAAEAWEVVTDPINDRYTAVASFQVNTIDLGALYTGLTRDDVAGLRYLMRFGNVNLESLGTNSLMLRTNATSQALNFLVTSNLADLAAIALTNDTPGLQAAFPGLTILSTTPYLAQVVTTNYFAYFTNFPWTPAGTPATLAYVTNYDTNIVFNYQHTLGNVVSNTFVFPNGYRFTNQSIFSSSLPVTSNLVTVIETNVTLTSSPWSPPGAGALTTNVTVTSMWTNMVVGDYFLPPTNLCGALLLSNVLTKVTAVTNTPLAATNFVSTNGQFYSISYVTYFTNHVFAYFPVECVTNAVGRFHGVERIRFVRRDGYDPLTGQYIEPLQTNYSIVVFNPTNNQNVTQTVSRVVTQPDILFSAQDFAPGPAVGPRLLYAQVTRNINFNQALTGGTPGPGTIEAPTLITFDKTGPVFRNTAGGSPLFFLDESTQVGWPLWASYDETTNAPIVFPNGASIEELENRLVIQIQPSTLADGQVNVAYSAQLAVLGGTPPYLWTLSPTSAGLPYNLSLSPDGLLSGRPMEAGVYDFSIRVTDAGGRYVEQVYSLKINP